MWSVEYGVSFVLIGQIQSLVPPVDCCVGANWKPKGKEANRLYPWLQTHHQSLTTNRRLDIEEKLANLRYTTDHRGDNPRNA